MSSQFLSLEEAAKRLGITSDRMVELRSQGKIRGFRDGASWKFPENELDRLADELAAESGAYDPYSGFDEELADDDSDEYAVGSGGSGLLVDERDLGSSISPRSGSKIIGGDAKSEAAGSDVGVGSESPIRLGSDVNLIAGDSNGSDVKVVTGQPGAGDSDDFTIEGGRGGLVEIDSGELQLSSDEPVITHDSAVLDLAIEPNAGSTGPITDKELKELADQNPDLAVGKKPVRSDSGLTFDDDDEDSDDDLIGVENEDDLLGSDLELQAPANAPASSGGGAPRGSSMSSLEMLDDLDLDDEGSSKLSSGRSSRGIDVLSELDLLSADAGGSGLITGDSGNVMDGAGSGSGSGKKAGVSESKGSGLEFDDALADDDDLVIADDEDDLVLGGGASDVSVSGDSGINLMSPSDSGLSLESEPLDLAGSSISALDLGSEFGGGSGIGSDSGSSSSAKARRGSAGGDEDFRLSPSGVGVDVDDSSQVIEIEDSSAFAGGDGFDEADFGEAMPEQDAFGDEALVEGDALEEDDGFGVTAGAAPARAGVAAAYEVPFSIFQVSMLLVTLMIMCLGGMLMTDLLRNMWAYTDTAAPVSSLTDALVSLANLGG